MRIKPTYKIALAALVLVVGCQKNDLDSGQVFNDGTVKYAVTMGQSEVTDGSATKGTLINTEGSDQSLSDFAEAIGKKFVVKAYDGATEQFSQTVNWSDGAWVATPVAYWPQAKNLTFLAYANLPGSQTAEIASAGVSTTHTVPATAGEQKDILFGHYKGNGGNTGTANIRFEHPLTAVQFKYGSIPSNPKIKSISLAGVAASGTATMSQTGSISWSVASAYDKTVSQSNDSGLPVAETTKLIGEPFIIIPQNLSEHNVTVFVTLEDDTVVGATINAGQWQEGKTNTYTLEGPKIIDANNQDYSGHVL